MGIIYIWTCKDTNKSYIGKTINPKVRKRKHLSAKDNTYFHNALHKYENWDYKVLEDNIPKELLDEREIYWIKTLNTLKPNGYNLTKGGEGGNTWDNLPEEQKEDIKKKILKRRKRVNCKKIEYNGKIYDSITDMCKDNNIKYQTYLTQRCKGFPTGFHPLYKRTICDNKEYSSIEKMCKDNNINLHSFRCYLSRWCKDRENIDYHGHKIKIYNTKL